MRIALPAINPTVGDLTGNETLIRGAVDRARAGGADLVVLPELVVCGYPPRDLLLHEGFVGACAETAKRIGEQCSRGLTLVFGAPLPSDLRPGGIANALLAFRDGEMLDYYDKRLLPTYDVFDEDRYFTPGERAVVIDVMGKKVGLSVCEDAWRGDDVGFSSRYAGRADPIAQLAEAGAELIVSSSASPFVLGPNGGKSGRHIELLRAHAQRHGVAVCSANQLGGNDELIFDGQAALVGPDGTLRARREPFADGPELFDLDFESGNAETAPPPTLAPEEAVFRALTLGVRDYVRKTGFSKVVIGLSGGIDSAAVCAVAVAALGAENVTGFALPGKYSSDHSKSDAYDLADRLGIACPTVPIAEPFDGFRATIDPVFAELGEPALGEKLPDVTEENLQSRVRGGVMMTISNRTGALLLTTGNKSEIAVGYCTLYGDMNGGLAVISDVPKTMVYRLCRYLNEHGERLGFDRPPIPENTIEKPPSAELAPDQTDQDSLPPYEQLDEIIERYVERRQAPSVIGSESDIDRDLVNRITRLIDRNEYKRKQMATGLKVAHVAFGAGRRMPIAQRWSGS